MDIIKASEKGDKNRVAELLAEGADPNKKDGYGMTAQMYASEKGYKEIVDILLAAGANPNEKDFYNQTALMHASLKGHKEIVETLLAAGADPNIQDNDNETPLSFATSHHEIIKILLEKGANPNVTNNTGETPLISAAGSNHKKVVEVLLAGGADPNIQDGHGNTALMHALDQYSDNQIIKALIDGGTNINLQNKNGKTALFLAAKEEKIGIVRDLLDLPQIENIGIENGKTMVDLAKDNAFIPSINQMIIERFEAKEAEEDADQEVWKGWTRSDSEKLDVIFDQKAADYACCPVCLKFVERSDACMYMSHNCRELGGFVHNELYEQYKNPEGKIAWCTICGRIAIGHRHYKLGLATAATPQLGPSGEPFEKDCSRTSGGGGLPEKLARFRRMREFAKELMEAGEISENTALTQLIEETWNAPLVRKPVLPKLLAEKRWNFPHTNFPSNVIVNQAAPVVARNFPRPAPNRNNVNLQPIVHPVGMNTILQDEEAENVIQFRHRKKDGTINNHETTWISKESLERMIALRVKHFGEEHAIYCWNYPACDALLYPEEIKGFVPDELYESYKTMFNQQMTIRQGGQGGGRRRFRITRKGRGRLQRGGQQDFFKEATNAVCVIVKKPSIGGRRRIKTKRTKRPMKKQTHKRRK